MSLDSPARRTWVFDEPFPLESGEALPRLEIAYHIYGEIAPSKRVVWVCHALTGSSEVSAWWPGLLGEGKLFDPRSDVIVCANVPGSCYGSSGPLSLNPSSGKPYFREFPQFSVRDMARALDRLRTHLKVERIDLGIGGSMGGQMLLEWAILQPELFCAIVPIATNARHSPWGIAFNAAQRLAIEADPSWTESRFDAGRAGLKCARAVGIISYRSYESFQKTQSDSDSDSRLANFRAESYLAHQGEKLAERFQAVSYWALSRAMDGHNVGRGRDGVEEALRTVKARTLVVGISSDVLFPVREQHVLAHSIPQAEYREIDSSFGHDGFLVETDRLMELVRSFLTPIAEGAPS